MVSSSLADPAGASGAIDAPAADPRWSHDLDTAPLGPRPPERQLPSGSRLRGSSALRLILERIVERTHAVAGADTCALLRLVPATGTLYVSVIAGRNPVTPIQPIAIGPVPVAEPMRIVLADSNLDGWLSSIPGFGALLVGWDRRTAIGDSGIVELAARLAAAAIDQERTESLAPSAWQFVSASTGGCAAPMIASDATGRLFHLNEAARDLLALANAPGGRARHLQSVYRALDLRDQLGQRINPTMLPAERPRAGNPAPDLIVSVRNHHAERQWMLLHGEAIRDGHGDIVVVLTTLQDFTTMQRYGEAQWLRARIADHLHRCPLDLASIERTIASFLADAGMTRVTLEEYRRHTQAEESGPRVTTWHDPDEGAAVLREIRGHLHHTGLTASSELGRASATRTTHSITIPITGDGETLAQLTCVREANQRGFQQDETDLLTEVAEQIGLALTVTHLRESLHDGQRRLIDIGRRLQDAGEAERRRMALSIHDGLAQVAASVCQQLEILADRYAPSSAAELQELERARELARRTVREARQLISGLRPVTLDAHGLGAAVREEVEALRHDGWSMCYRNDLGSTRLAPDTEIEVFRVVQEALTNARKYACSNTIDVALEHHGATLRFEVRDQGTGFDPIAAERAGRSGTHVGLGGMRERIDRLGGVLRIDTEPDRGTRIVGEVPIPNDLAR